MKKLFLSLLVVAALFMSSGTITANKAEAYYGGSSYTSGSGYTYYSDGGYAYSSPSGYTYYSNPITGVYGSAYTSRSGYTYYNFDY